MHRDGAFGWLKIAEPGGNVGILTEFCFRCFVNLLSEFGERDLFVVVMCKFGVQLFRSDNGGAMFCFVVFQEDYTKSLSGGPLRFERSSVVLVVGLVGPGLIGKTLLDQFRDQVVCPYPFV